MTVVTIRETESGRFHLNGFGVTQGGRNRDRQIYFQVVDASGKILKESKPTTATALGIAERGRGDYDNDSFRQSDIVIRKAKTGPVAPHSPIGKRIPWKS